MEYISPGKQQLSLARLLTTAATVLLCLTSTSLGNQYRHPDGYGPRTKHNNMRHNRHQQGRHSDKTHGFRDFPYDYEDSTVMMKPEFLNTETNITVTEGRMATLPCSVRYLGTKQVAWRRLGANKSFLTVGTYVWAKDSKINVSHMLDDHQVSKWNLQIKNVNMSNAGTYQCQITDKVPLHMHVHLTVKPRPPPQPAAVKITGEPFVDQGTPIHLTCNATGPRIPEKIDWFKDGTKLDAAAHGNMQIEEYMHVVDHHALISELLIRHTDIKNSGTYICRSSYKKIDSLKVTVLVADTTNKKRGTYVDVKSKELLIGNEKREEKDEKNPRDSAVSFHSTRALALTVSLCIVLHRLLS